VKYPWLDPRQIASAAGDLLSRSVGSAGTGAPCVDLETIVYDCLCEKDGMSFDDERDLGWKDGDQVLGRMKPLAGKIEITAALKRPEDVGRYRFTLAHEIGHWVLHRPLFLAEAQAPDLFGPRDVKIQMTSLNRNVFPSGPARPVVREEWQANRFAVELLIDPDVLRIAFVERFNAQVIARASPDWIGHSRTLHEHARHLAKLHVRGLDPLGSVFGLSADAMGIALVERGYALEQPPIL
jgi:hypothetical protein